MLGRWEREINPLLIQNQETLSREEGLRALAHVLQKIVDEELSVPKVFFHKKYFFSDFLDTPVLSRVHQTETGRPNK